MTEKADIAAIFRRHPEVTRAKLLALRRLIIDTAARTDGVGRIEETLRWGQISYLTPETRSGTTIRIDAEGDGVALFVNCQTNLVERYKAIYPETFEYSGSRAILIPGDRSVDEAALAHCIAMALTYHRRVPNNKGRPKVASDDQGARLRQPTISVSEKK